MTDTQELLKSMKLTAADEINPLGKKDPRTANYSEDEKREHLSVNYAMLQKMLGGVHTKAEIVVDGHSLVMRLLAIDELNSIEQEVAEWWKTLKTKPEEKSICFMMQLRMKMIKTLRRAFSSSPECITDADLIMNQELGTGLNEKGLGHQTEFYISKYFKAYSEFENKYNPTPDSLTEQQLKEAVGGLLEKKLTLNIFSYYQLIQIMAKLLNDATITLQTDK